ncbi:MAG: hypothetical protein ACREDR_08635 [Blastocatellia bacterium]
MGRKTTSISARKRNLILKGDTSFKGLVATLATRFSFASGRNENVDAAARKLLFLARQASVSRDIDALDTISDLILESFNGSSIAEVARFHKARCLRARGDVPAGRKLLTEVIERAGSKFRARGILALGTSYYNEREYSECRFLYLQAANAADESDPLTRLQSLRAVAVVRAIEGDHLGSLSVLQSLLPQNLYVGRWYPADFYDHLNSIAIEMGELGRVDEATRIINRVLRTQFAKNCPQWLDTKIELANKRRLAFPPFTMAVGAPAEPRPQNDVETQAKVPDLRQRAQADSQAEVATECRPDIDNAAHLIRSRSQKSKRAVAVCSARTPNSVAISLATPFAIQAIAIQTGRNTPGLAFQATYADRGYAVSPPARAPPARLRNSKHCNSNNRCR